MCGCVQYGGARAWGDNVCVCSEICVHHVRRVCRAWCVCVRVVPCRVVSCRVVVVLFCCVFVIV